MTGWCTSRPVAISGTMFAASQAMTLAALKYPLSASRVSTWPSSSGRAFKLLHHRLKLLFVIGRLHHIGGHHQRLSAATTAWAL